MGGPSYAICPDWFVRLLVMPEYTTAFPVMIEGRQVGDIVVAPDMAADIYEKWIGFLAIACSGITLMLLTGAIAHFAARSALRPLQSLGDGLTRMRTGDYEQPVAPTGPPEIRKSWARIMSLVAKQQNGCPGFEFWAVEAVPSTSSAASRTP